MMSVTSVRIESDLELPLEQVAKDLDRPKGWIINAALRDYLEHRALELKQWQDTLEALEDIRMGRVVEGDKVHAWLQGWGTADEQDAPVK